MELIITQKAITVMGLFETLFRKKKNSNPSRPAASAVSPLSSEGKDLIELINLMNAFLLSDRYVSKKEYQPILEERRSTIDFFATLERSGMLETYCRENRISKKIVEDALNQYSRFEEFVDHSNTRYVSNALETQRDYLDNLLNDVDPSIMLDEDQRRVVLTDEDYCLVIAGAGAGKTTTVAAKVKYLVDRNGVDPSKILVISFTNKAVDELKERINGKLGIDCPITTFHSTGNAIIRKGNPDKQIVIDSNGLYYVVQEYFKSTILKNESAVNNLILFFASYFDAPYEGRDLNDFFNKVAKSNYNTLKSDLDEFRKDVIDARTKKAVTIQSEFMRSYQEVEIANFLYLNGIEYEYEPIYRYDIQFSRKPYTPDFRITQEDRTAYIEHFGITESGKNSKYSEDELQAYKKAINDKILLHRTHGTKLIYTFSSFNDRRPLTEHLKEQLEKNGFELRPRSNQEVLEKLVSTEENRYIRKLVALVTRFIHNFKVNAYNESDFARLRSSTQNVRSKLFLSICHDCYLQYQQYLKKNSAVDFEDMINESARLLNEVEEVGKKLDFKYVIVDEYQDISKQRFDLVSALSKVTDAKIIAVGDDWQSIYAFSGSDITLFTNFEEKMGYAKLLKIVRTYRNSQEVIDIAGGFIQRNPAQITKSLISPKHIKDPVIVYTYDRSSQKGGNATGADYNLAVAVENALKAIMYQNDKSEISNRTSSILLLGRYGFDGDKLEKTGLFELVPRSTKIKSVRYPYLDITFMTAHSSKGLGYDNVIIINCKNETYGFPSKIEDDPVLSLVIKGDSSIDYAEERRLFYVAMTRTKNRVYCVAPEQNPSEFVLELKRDYGNVVLRGEWNEEPPEDRRLKNRCPICGYPLQHRYKVSYGLNLWICTNEPEICGFMTNQTKGGKLSICKCDKCVDGYLIVKPGKNSDYFLGCTNYKKDGSGCDNVISKRAYYDQMGYTIDVPDPGIASPEAPDEPVERTVSSPKKARPQPAENLYPTEDIERAELKTVMYKGMDLNQTVLMILNTLNSVSNIRFYGKNMLISILRGIQDDRITKNKLDLIKGFGSLSYLSREEIDTIIEWMLDKHYMLRTNHPDYPVLHPTSEGMHYSESITSKDLKNLKSNLESL